MEKIKDFLPFRFLRKSKMKKKAEGLPVNTLIVIIIALLVLALTLIFFSLITGKEIFPSIMDKVKMALGLWNQSSSNLP